MAATQTKVRIRPLHDRVIVQRLEEGEQKVGGIIIPDSAKEKPQQGRVPSVGDGRLVKGGQRVGCQVQEGDRVLFTAWAGTEIKVADDEVLILREDDILAVLD